MKKILDAVIIIVLSLSVFTLAASFRAFQINFVALIGPTLLYFLVGLTLRTYYDGRKRVFLFFGITILLSTGVLVAPNMASTLFMLMLITGLLIVANLSLGYFFNYMPKVIAYLTSFVMIGFVSYISFNYMPKSVAQKSIESYSNLHNQPFTNFTSNTKLKDTTNNLVKNYIQKDSIYLLEFFFKNCMPCKLKEKMLPRIAYEFKNQPFKIIYVDNAELDNFKTFSEGIGQKAYAENLYDEGNLLIQNLKIQSFPVEIILDKKGIIRHTYSGYNFDADNEYFKITTNKIKNLLNE